jgi:hypothetical protein
MHHVDIMSLEIYFECFYWRNNISRSMQLMDVAFYDTSVDRELRFHSQVLVRLELKKADTKTDHWSCVIHPLWKLKTITLSNWSLESYLEIVMIFIFYATIINLNIECDDQNTKKGTHFLQNIYLFKIRKTKCEHFFIVY